MSSANQQEANLSAHGPRHVAIIMDGNGRWAKRQGKLRVFGHKAGVKSVRRAVSFAASHHLDALTLYAFSSENWNRPAQEVSALMELFVRALDSEVKSLHKHNVRLRVIGDVSRLLGERVCMSDLSPVDLVIRTGGEHRISNFLLWQIAYAELYFTDVLWPDVDELVFEGALNAFAQRERRFGGTTPIDANAS